MPDLADQYAQRYAGGIRAKLYPVEFVVRAFLGSYPRLTINKHGYAGKKALDLGCGDGRNLEFLSDLGFRTHAVEISDPICETVRRRTQERGLDTIVRVGSNSSIPFDNAWFDYVLCCHSLYYVKPGETFDNNLHEVARVMVSGGTLLASLPKKYDGYTQTAAERLPDNHAVVRNDPLGLRNGVVFRVFEDEAEIRRVFGPRFHDIQLGWLENDFFGIEERLWIVKMTRI
jgi:SAM-dependent methyltransferase